MRTIILFIFITWTTIVVGQPCPITYSVTQTGESCTGCCDGSISVTNLQGGCAAYSFLLYPGPIGSGNGQFTNLCSQVYTVIVQDAGCCGPVTTTICVDFICNPTEIIEYSNPIKVMVDNNQIVFNNYNSNTSLNIYDLTGLLILSSDNIDRPVDLSRLQNGLYLLLVYERDKIILRRKFVKN